MRLRWAGMAAAVACVLSVALPAPIAQAAPGPLIQPGELSESGGALCTLSFVFDGGGTFVSTAAHCVPGGVGADVALSDGTVFGDVAAIGNERTTAKDWALIRVRNEHLGRVSPAVKGIPTAPRGVTTPAETQFLSQVQQSGYGMGFDLTGPTREQRVGLLTYDDAQLYTTLGATIFGDSGGPIVHKPTGKALGIVSRLCIGTCEMEGPTVQGIITKAAAKGFNIQLRTV